MGRWEELHTLLEVDLAETDLVDTTVGLGGHHCTRHFDRTLPVRTAVVDNLLETDNHHHMAVAVVAADNHLADIRHRLLVKRNAEKMIRK